MSWIKRRGQPSPNTTNPEVPMYNPSQHSNPQQPYQQWPQQYSSDWYSQSKAPARAPAASTNNYWQQPPYNHPQPNYNTNVPSQPVNQYQQYNQYSNTSAQPQNYYQNTGFVQENYQQQNYAPQNYYSGQQPQISQTQPPQTQPLQAPQNQPAVEADPWNWDWDDAANSNTKPQEENSRNPVKNNITDSFANDESWNWSVDDSAQAAGQNGAQQKAAGSSEEAKPRGEQNTADASRKSSNSAEIPRSSDTVEELPGLPALRRIQNENLTPQWSIESQMSQDSSEDVLLTSESDNRSNVLSQSSTTSQSPSRPASTHGSGNDYYCEKPQEAGSLPGEAENSVAEPANSEYYQQSVVDVARGVQELSLGGQFENREIVAPEGVALEPAGKEAKEAAKVSKAAPKMTDKNPYKKKPPQKPTSKLLAPKELPGGPTGDLFMQNQLPSAGASFQVPQRQLDTLGVNLETVPDNSERPDQLPVQLPAENLQKNVRSLQQQQQQQWPENCEIAPINDRNQYLETGQLSDADLPVYSQPEDDFQAGGAQGADSLPPPGLRRLVLGQLEQPDNNQPPPPGLSRMVPGGTAQESRNFRLRQTATAGVFHQSDYENFQNSEEPPVGLHRMVPGESSSPESSSYILTTDAAVFQPAAFVCDDNYVSESELNQMGVSLVSQRSATIGADTPPVSGQITTASYSSSSSTDPIPSREATMGSREAAVGIDNEADPVSSAREERREAAVGIDNELSEPDKKSSGLDKKSSGSLDKKSSGSLDEKLSSSLPPESNRSEDIDGGPQDEISPVRDQTVGQNTTDGPSSGAGLQDKHRSRNYTTDSEHEQPKERHNRNPSPGGRGYDKGSRYYEDRRDRHRDRDSPDRYRGERKYDKRRQKDRRYEEDTDYYSDKERNERRHREDRDEYDRRYNSLRRDKDRDKRREIGDRRDYDRDERRNDYYYNSRYEGDYYNVSNRSRPSSRSDSMHDSYRERNNRPHDRDHDRTRHRDRDHDRDRHRRRDPYNPYYQGYNYDAYNPYYHPYQYQYYENMRRTNPQAYAEWYRKYYQSQGGAGPHAPGYSTEDRASVHSGRSSANEELNKDRYTRQSYYSQQSLPHYYREIPNASTVYTVDDSRLLDQTDSSLIFEDVTAAPQRLTPAKFSTAHVKASISSGQLVNILPHYPVDGQPAILEIINLQTLLQDDEEQKELAEFPGPLTKNVTHKKTVIEYCEMKIRKAQGSPIIQDVESYVLMWELLILLLRQNGMVVGTDIAELLMKNRTFENSRRQSVSSSSSTQHVDTVGELSEHARISPSVHYKEDYITEKFREFLIYGSGKEALEWAMKHGLWGHALFLASKLDKRTYANVMMRFANGLTMNDPLQTLYQLLSGRQPAAVTCVVDEKWGDWRPHLAMILSNTTQRPDLDRRAITTLGDTLLSRGSLYAAHFCYLMAQVEFGRYGAPNVKLVLLSSSQNKPFSAFATNEAIFMTEIYEYACSLSDPAFTIPEFQPYIYLMATRMVDHGLLEKGLLYLERAALNIKQDPSRAQPSLVSRICELADRLKYCDPAQDEGEIDNTRAESSWLTDLKLVLNDYNMGLITHQSTSNLTALESDPQQEIKPIVDQPQNADQWHQQQQQQADFYHQNQSVDQQQSWQNDQQQQNLDFQQQQIQQQQQISYQENDMIPQTGFENSANYQEQQHYWNQQQQQIQQQQQPIWDENVDGNQQVNEEHSNYWNTTAQSEQPAEIKKEPSLDEIHQPQISMPNQEKGNFFYDEQPENAEESTVKPASPVKPKPPVVQPKQASSGWFGGIWSKLALRPKNQMKLPDDKNPTIVWDPEKKRWVNLEEDNGDSSNEIKPPPKMSEMFPMKPPSSCPASLPAQIPIFRSTASSPGVSVEQKNNPPNPPHSNPSAQAPIEAENSSETPKASLQPNMFKLQRGRNIKKAYVDVFNPGGAKSGGKSTVPAPEIFGAVPTSTGAPVNFFVPQPVSDPNAPTDFLTSQGTIPEDNSQLSRWSSTSSLSREVQFYMQRPQNRPQGSVPAMYNPNQFSNQQVAGRYPNP